MASTLLLVVRPIVFKVLALFVANLAKEASEGKLPNELKPFAPEIVAIADVLLSTLGGANPPQV